MFWFAVFVVACSIVCLLTEAYGVVAARGHLAKSQRLINERSTNLDQSGWPSACIVLCIRGLDSTLHRTLEALSNQEYPEFAVHIVVDDDHDEAASIIREIESQTRIPNLTWSGLETVHTTCSRKVSSLLQAFGNLPEQAEIVVTIDGDVVPTRDWLRSLIALLDVPGVGGATAVRRYMPEAFTLGGVIRSYWSCFATNWITITQVGWGGSLALRRSLVDDTKVRERLLGAFGEDTVMSDEVLERGETVRTAPGIVSINYGDCTLSVLANFLRRQTFSVRLHHRGWPIIAYHGLSEPVMIAIGLCHVAMAGAYGQLANLFAATVYFGTGIFVIWTGKFTGATSSDAASARFATLSSVSRFSKLLLAIFLMPFVYAATIASLWISNEHCWRGITYRLRKRHAVEIVSDCSKRREKASREHTSGDPAAFCEQSSSIAR